MECCPAGPGSCEPPAAETRRVCPRCGRRGKPVGTLTVKSLVRDHTRVASEEPYWFCRTPDCDVVYFGPAGIFRKPEVKVRVGVKERDDPIPLCYCFDYTRADVRREIEERGRTGIPARIKAEVQAGFCACEVKNPAGTCCLGEIAKAVQEVQRALRPGPGTG